MKTNIKYKTPDLILIDLRKSVNDLLKQKEIYIFGGKKIAQKALLLFGIWISLYFTILFSSGFPVFATYVLYGLLGLNFVLVGFNVMHDGSHGSFSRKKWVNNAVLLTHDCLQGISAFLWKIKHVRIHHSHTNTEDDEDINAHPILRLNPNQKRFWFHRFQAFYAPIIYCFLFLAWIFYTDFRKIFTRKIQNYEILKSEITIWEIARIFTTKIIFIGILIITPSLLIGFEKAIIGFLILSFVCGFFISIVFQLAHVIETSSFPKTEKILTERTWAENQILETSNFATKSKLATWLLGGLNFQIEHHLFPKISHVNYPIISTLVEEIVKKNNLKYNNLSLKRAIVSHFKMLNRLGKD